MGSGDKKVSLEHPDPSLVACAREGRKEGGGRRRRKEEEGGGRRREEGRGGRREGGGRRERDIFSPACAHREESEYTESA